jgi:hypothetical protein
MKVNIRIINDEGVTLVEYEDDAAHPTQSKLARPIPMNGYQFFGFTYQPHVRLETKAGGY